MNLLRLFSLVLDHLLTTALRQGLELPLDLLRLLVLYPLMMILQLLRDLSLPPRLDLEPYEGEGSRSGATAYTTGLPGYRSYGSTVYGSSLAKADLDGLDLDGLIDGLICIIY